MQFLTFLFPYKFLRWRQPGKMYYALCLTEPWNKIGISAAWPPCRLFPYTLVPSKRKQNHHNTRATVNSYRIKNVICTLPIIKSPGNVSWCSTRLFSWPKTETSSRCVESFWLWPELPSTLAQSRVSETHKHTRVFFRLRVPGFCGRWSLMQIYGLLQNFFYKMCCGRIKTISFPHLFFNYQICKKESYRFSCTGF